MVQEFHKKAMMKVQGKLKECVEKQCMTMESLERLSNALHTTSSSSSNNNNNTNNDDVDDTTMTTTVTAAVVAAAATADDEEAIRAAAKELRGENKALGTGSQIHKKTRIRTKHHSSKSVESQHQRKEKNRPRYFVQF
jgi:hypothetical protein